MKNNSTLRKIFLIVVVAIIYLIIAFRTHSYFDGERMISNNEVSDFNFSTKQFHKQKYWIDNDFTDPFNTDSSFNQPKEVMVKPAHYKKMRTISHPKLIYSSFIFNESRSEFTALVFINNIPYVVKSMDTIGIYIINSITHDSIIYSVDTISYVSKCN